MDVSGSLQPAYNAPPKSVEDVIRAIQTRTADTHARREAQRWDDYATRRGYKHGKPREGEKQEDYARRRKHWSYVSGYVLDRLTSALYGRPPRRQWSPESSFLESVWESNRADEFFRAVDRAALVGGVAAIQCDIVDADDQPARLWLYKRHEYTVWTERDDPAKPWAVATFAGDDSATLWTKDAVWKFAAPSVKAGELKPTRTGNPYGRLPFAFAPTTPQIDEFWVAGLGCPLADLNAVLDQHQNDLAQAFAEYAIPLAVGKNLAETSQLSRKPGSVQTLSTMGGVGFGEQGAPAIEFVAPTIQWEQLTTALKRLRDDTLRELCPDTLLQGHASASSGIQLLVAQAELVQYVTERRLIAASWEQAVADLVGKCETALNQRIPRSTVSLSWPRRLIPLDLPDFQQMDQADLSARLTSRVALYQERHGLSRERALDALAEIDADTQADEPAPAPAPEAGSTSPPAGGG